MNMAIPKPLLEDILKDNWYKECCVADDECSGRIEFHHVLIVGGRQLQEKFAIIPVCSGYHHQFAERSDLKEKFLHIVLSRASLQELKLISKAVNYKEKLVRLNKKYGILQHTQS
jgi:hypothetical protein